MKYLHLCLHTLRADCNGLSIVRMKLKCTFASTRSVQIATVKSIGNRLHTIFASTRSVQIATQFRPGLLLAQKLCLHTLRADCNATMSARIRLSVSFASTRSVQIATGWTIKLTTTLLLCLHTLRADCNSLGLMVCMILPRLCLHTLRADCNGRNAQNCNMHFSERVLSW